MTVAAAENSHGPQSPRASREAWVYLIATFVFALSAGGTVWFCRSMAGGMDMPGRWTMSMMWMPMPGQTPVAAAGMFLLMWLAMMVAMMLPSALPGVVIYRRLLHFRGDERAGLATATMAAAYFLVWLGVGIVAYLLGASAGRAAMRWTLVSRAVPAASGILLIVCGWFQLTPWKRACLQHCRDPLGFIASCDGGSGRFGAWRLGLHHGLFCAGCCWALMVIQLVLGVMSLTVMASVATVIALEKLLPRSEWVVRLTGIIAVGIGLLLIGRAALR